MLAKGKQALADAAKELADQLQLVENVKALQVAQKELADAVKAIGERIQNLEADMRIVKSEIKLEAIKETQAIVNAVQGGLSQRIEDISIKMALFDSQRAPTILDSTPRDRPRTRRVATKADGAQS